jgi:hypothetical protein
MLMLKWKQLSEIWLMTEAPALDSLNSEWNWIKYRNIAKLITPVFPQSQPDDLSLAAIFAQAPQGQYLYSSMQSVYRLRHMVIRDFAPQIIQIMILQLESPKYPIPV